MPRFVFLHSYTGALTGFQETVRYAPGDVIEADAETVAALEAAGVLAATEGPAPARSQELAPRKRAGGPRKPATKKAPRVARKG